MTDSQKMLLIQCLPIGASYEEAKQVIPEISDLRPEGASGNFGLQEASATITILDRSADLEINFRDSHVYAYLFWVRDSTQATADSLDIQVAEFYTARFGASTTETDAEPNHTYTGSYWCPGSYGVVLGRTDYSGYSLVAWGFQDRCPGSPTN